MNTLPEDTIRKAGSNWVASRNEITRNSSIHITGVDAETRKGFLQLAERAATVCSTAVYERVRADRSPEGVTVRYWTKGGREGTRQLRTGSIARDLDSHGLRAWTLHRGTAREARSLADAAEGAEAVIGPSDPLKEEPTPGTRRAPAEEIVIRGRGRPAGGAPGGGTGTPGRDRCR